MLYVRSLRWKNVILKKKKKKKKKNRGIGGVGKGDNVHVTRRVVFFLFISLFYGVSWRYRFFGEVFQDLWECFRWAGVKQR